ncbi:dTMP kinase [Henriciella sp. AS95]|uniref:dTMP kinase n=1 Tax=Henriciella sp. AS95 TaxID=3135782 RepID=UPI00316BF95D
MSRGCFITIEGGEGAGKSTLISGLERELSARGLEIVTTREPGGTVLAEQIRNLVLNPPDASDWSPIAEALLMNAARADHVEKKIAPALEGGRWVICDRFADSTRVYQGIGGVGDEVLRLMQVEVTQLASPDITLVMDGPVEKLINRRDARGTSDVFERRPLDFHRKVRDRFLAIATAEPDRCAVLDAMQAPEEVLRAAMNVIDQRVPS